MEIIEYWEIPKEHMFIKKYSPLHAHWIERTGTEGDYNYKGGVINTSNPVNMRIWLAGAKPSSREEYESINKAYHASKENTRK